MWAEKCVPKVRTAPIQNSYILIICKKDIGNKSNIIEQYSCFSCLTGETETPVSVNVACSTAIIFKYMSTHKYSLIYIFN